MSGIRGNEWDTGKRVLMEDTIWSLMNLTLTIDKYNAVKSCMINGAAAGPAACSIGCNRRTLKRKK